MASLDIVRWITYWSKGNEMKLPDILSDERIDAAAKLVDDYYNETFSSGQPRAGSRFDSWAGGGDAPETENTFTANDLLAVSFLGVDVPGAAIIGLLDTYSERAEGLLAEIPTDVDLGDVDSGDLDDLLGEGSAAWKLWDLVRGKQVGKWGIGPTRASKVLARKRPRLIPIYDSVVKRVTGMESSMEQWTEWHAALAEETGLPQRLQEIKRRSGTEEPISALRVLDVVLWMYGRQVGIEPEPAEDDEL